MSLRRATTLILALVLAVLAGVGALAAYWSARHEANEFLDRQQEQIARYVGDPALVAGSRGAAPSRHPDDDYVIEVTYPDGRPPASSHPDIPIPDRQASGFSEFDDSRGHWRVFSLVSPARTVQVAQRTVAREELARDAAVQATLPFVFAIPLSWAVLEIIVSRLFRRLESLADEVAKRSATDLTPLPAAGVPSEVLPLIASMNALLDRLRQAMARQRDFLSNAAHELRTPLTALTLQISNLRRLAKDGEMISSLDELDAGARRASALTAQLLRIARYESLEAPDARNPVRLDEVVVEVIAGLVTLADERGIDLGFAEKQAVTVLGSATDLRVLVEVLVDNAIRYTQAGGTVDVSVADDSEGALLTVADTGPGVPVEALPRLTDRFFRAAGQDIDGSGLGLSIAQTIADRHAAVLRLANRDDRAGFVAMVALPRSPQV
jgi:two-component system OmpR family sensor kinase